MKWDHSNMYSFIEKESSDNAIWKISRFLIYQNRANLGLTT